MRDRDDIDMESWARRAFDEEPTPGSFGDTVRDDLTRAHRGLTRRRRWAAAGTSGVAVAAVAFAIALAPGARDVGTDPGPASGGSDQGDSDSDTEARLTAIDQRLVDECEQVASHTSAQEYDNSALADGKISAGELTETVPATGRDLDGWTVVDRMDDDWGTTAILLNPDGDRWAECTIGEQADFHTQAVRTPQEVPRGFVQQPDGEYVWKGGDYVSWAQNCIQVSGPDRDCTRDLYFMTTRLPVGVDSISVETYDGAVSQAQVTDGFVLWRDFGPVLNDYEGELEGSSTVPPIVLSYQAPNGEVLSSYNSEFLPPIPDGECTGSGGC